MKKQTLFFLLLIYGTSLMAKEIDSTKILEKLYYQYVDSVNNAFKWQQGKINIHNNIAQLNIPSGYRFMNAEQSQFVLEELWDNLKDSSVLGMIFPVDKGPFDSDFTPFIISFNEIGFVKDDDADEIDYTELLKSLKEESVGENNERLKLNLMPLLLIGWAQQPFYDKEKKILHWAKEYKSSDSTENTLNYDIRILGRNGVLSINAVGGMSLLPHVKQHIQEIITMASFNEGHRFKDFDENIDDVAAWTLGGLVAGKVLAKVGFLGIFLKFFKFILLGLAASGGAIWKFLTGKKKSKPTNVIEENIEDLNTNHASTENDHSSSNPEEKLNE